MYLTSLLGRLLKYYMYLTSVLGRLLKNHMYLTSVLGRLLRENNDWTDGVYDLESRTRHLTCHVW